MSIIRTVIVDDEAPARRRVKSLLKEFDNYQLIGEAENGYDAIQIIKSSNPDLVLLDIQLKDMNGFEVLSAIKNEYSGHVIFITAFDEFAIKAFEENAVDYLLKPFKNSRFKDALSRIVKNQSMIESPELKHLMNYIQNSQQEYITIKEGNTIHKVLLNDLIYVKAESYYNHFISNSTSKMIRISLKETNTLLPPNFIKINRSIIINTEKISAIKSLKKSSEVTLENGETFMTTTHISL